MTWSLRSEGASLALELMAFASGFSTVERQGEAPACLQAVKVRYAATAIGKEVGGGCLERG